uniref:G-protein coupled receptors family 3 profile domain-containing protein n=1 Tax=Latimeria chalumnae TaxID=7897 RepID=H3AGJ6_LATCH
YRWIHSLVFTIEEINRSNFLSNITLGFRIYDSCHLKVRAIEGTMSLITAVIGADYSVISMPVARLLGIYHIPQISHASSIGLLNNKEEFPSFFRTIPSDEFQSIGFARLVLHFGWKWIGLLADNSEYGQQGIQTVKWEIMQTGACIAFSEILASISSKKINNHVIEVIKTSSANVIVVFANVGNAIPYMDELVRQNITGKVWLASDGWSINRYFSRKEYVRTLSGTMGLTIRKGEISGFLEYLFNVHPSKDPNDIFIKEFWEIAFDCKWPEVNSNPSVTNELTINTKPCTGEENLRELNDDFLDEANLRYSYNVYTAMYAVAHSLRDMNTCKPGEGPFLNRTCANIRDFEPWQFKKKEFTAKHLNHNNEWTDATECLKCPDDQWSNELQDQCIPTTVEFLAYEDAVGATLAVFSIFCALLFFTVLCIFIKYRNTPIVKANNRELSYLLLLSLVLCFLSSLVFIGQPKTWSCMLRQTAFGIIFALSVSCVLAKTVMVVIAFNVTKPNSNLRKWVGPKLAISVVLVCTVIQIIICIVWLASAPPFPTENMKSQIGTIILECNDRSTIAFWCVLGYMGLLATISFVVAFLARNLPDSFNETKYITFSMLVFVSVWLAFIPAYLSTRGKYMVTVEIFAILASGAGSLACIFFPKCYIILLRPDMNKRESLMGKSK